MVQVLENLSMLTRERLNLAAKTKSRHSPTAPIRRTPLLAANSSRNRLLVPEPRPHKAPVHRLEIGSKFLTCAIISEIC